MDSLELINNLCANTGYTWIPEQDLRDYMLKKTKSSSLSFLNEKIQKGEIVISQVDGKRYISTKRYNDKENDVVQDVNRLLQGRHPKYDNWTLEHLIDAVESEKKLKLDTIQREAVKMACNNTLMVLTGGPGTGKTCVLSVISEVLKRLIPGIKICYAAPTGKAAKRMTESIGEPASTVSSLLKTGIDPDAKPEPIPKEVGCLIVDESSMLDIHITTSLLSAIATGTRLLFVGDTDQLPSVGEGAVLRDLIASGCVPVTKLTKTFRQAGDSTLFDNIQKIKRADYHLQSGEDFKIVCPKGQAKTEDVLLKLYLDNVSKYGMENVLLLTPFRKCGDHCSDKMNALIQKSVNGNNASKGVKLGESTIIAVGDPVMHLNNTNGLSNGDIGVIKSATRGSIVVEINHRVISIDPMNFLKSYALAYAMTVHKSQGSEAKCVITSMMDDDGVMKQRNLLYTAVTRAKKDCFLVCDPEAVKTAVKTEASHLRVTMLKEKLTGGLKNER